MTGNKLRENKLKENKIKHFEEVGKSFKEVAGTYEVVLKGIDGDRHYYHPTIILHDADVITSQTSCDSKHGIYGLEFKRKVKLTDSSSMPQTHNVSFDFRDVSEIGEFILKYETNKNMINEAAELILTLSKYQAAVEIKLLGCIRSLETVTYDRIMEKSNIDDMTAELTAKIQELMQTGIHAGKVADSAKDFTFKDNEEK